MHSSRSFLINSAVVIHRGVVKAWSIVYVTRVDVNKTPARSLDGRDDIFVAAMAYLCNHELVCILFCLLFLC